MKAAIRAFSGFLLDVLDVAFKAIAVHIRAPQYT